jgi:hypothetical protein
MIVILLFTKKRKHVLQSVMRRKRRLRKQEPAPAYPLNAKSICKHLQNREQL